MLSSVLSKSECAACKFCCSFRRTSLWETPVFSGADLEKLKALFPKAKFRPAEAGVSRSVCCKKEGAEAGGLAANEGISNNSYTFDISDQYKTSDPEEEAPCPFLDPKKGCSLPPELKPFDCKIWPLRAIRCKDKSIKVALTPTCPAINKLPEEKLLQLTASGLGQKILDFAASHPEIIKKESDFLSHTIYPL